MDSQNSLQSSRSKIKRVPKRGRYDRETLNQVLDAHYLCQVGFVHEGCPHVIPTLYARDGDRVLIHGSSKSRMLAVMKSETDICLSVTLVDGLVVARSVFHHSINYRSAVLYGQAVAIEEEAEKLRALEILTDHFLPGRWAEARLPSPTEMKATLVMALPISEGAAKVRTGPPGDDAADYDLDIWAGVIPTELRALRPVPDPALRAGIEVPRSVREFE